LAFSLNKVMLIGNLGQNAETRFTTTNMSVTSFSVATQNSYKGKDGNWVNETTWHKVISWNLSDFMKGKLVKGAKFYIEGRISYRDYTDKDGVKKYFTEIVSEKLIPLEGRDSGGNEDESNQNGKTGGFPTTDSDSSGAGTDDDLPF